MEASFVSRARTAITSAAAKAEKVFTDIKISDSTTHTDLDQQSLGGSTPKPSRAVDKSEDFHVAKNNRVAPRPLKTKRDWHDKLMNLRIGKKGAEDYEKRNNTAMAYAIFDENLYMEGEGEFSHSEDSAETLIEGTKSTGTNTIPPSTILKQLAIAVEAGLNYDTLKDLLAASRASSPIRERASMSLSAVKLLVLGEKDDGWANEFGTDERVLSVINALLNAGKVLTEGYFTRGSVSGLEEQIQASSVPRDIHGAPVESFVVSLSEAVGSLKTLQKMASFWSRIVTSLKRLWLEGQYIPGIPQDSIPDLNSCLLYQQLQVINCCISRKRRHVAAVEYLESFTAQASFNAEGGLTSDSTGSVDPRMYARNKSGELVLRLGADRECDNMTMLETGEPLYSPVLQEPPLLTEDLIKETEEFVLRTGSVGAGCSQLLADMQAFKAANPGSILEDFVRWHSPPDWVENDNSSDLDDTSDVGELSTKGQLSRRMQKAGNLWRKLWETSKPVPAVLQSPLFDEDLAVEGVLNYLEEISPSELFQQLFICVLGSGLATAEATLSSNSTLFNLFNECKNFIVTTCQGQTWDENLDDICQVYETVEMMVLNPDELTNMTVQSEETADEVVNHFKRLSLIFGGKSKSSSEGSTKDTKYIEESPIRQSLSIFFKKPPKPSPSTTTSARTSVSNDEWAFL